MRRARLRIQRPKESDWMDTVAAFARGYGLMRYPELEALFHCPNENSYRGRTGNWISPGYPDWGLDVARGGYHGLRIEQKRGIDSIVSDDQVRWLERLQKNDYAVFVSRSAQQTIYMLIDYLEGRIVSGQIYSPREM